MSWYKWHENGTKMARKEKKESSDLLAKKKRMKKRLNKRGEAVTIAVFLAAFVILSAGALFVNEFEGITGFGVLNETSLDSEVGTSAEFRISQAAQLNLTITSKSQLDTGTINQIVIIGTEANPIVQFTRDTGSSNYLKFYSKAGSDDEWTDPPNNGGVGTGATKVGSPTYEICQSGFGKGVISISDLNYWKVPVSGQLSHAKGTIDLWIKPQFDKSDTDRHFFFSASKGSPANTVSLKYEKYTWPQKLVFTVDAPGGALPYAVWSPNWNIGDSVHIRCVWDKDGDIEAGSSDTLRLYINGNLKASSTDTWTPGDIGDYMHVGCDILGQSHSDAYIDNFKIFDFCWPDFDQINEEDVSPPYYTLGTYLSSAYEINASALGKIRWKEDLTTGTDITFATRTGPNDGSGGYGAWEDWSDEVTDSAGSDITSTPNRYIQFRATFSSTDDKVTSKLVKEDGEVVAIEYTPCEHIVETETFDGETTNFYTVPDIANVTNATLEHTGYGKIKWLGAINATGADFDFYFNISHNYAFINSSALHSSMNSSAEIAFYNIAYTIPKILIDRGYGWEVCPETECQIIDHTDGNLTFNVTHFTAYKARENSNLTIWDDTDTQVKGLYDLVGFYANYTWTNGTAIDDSIGDCDIKFNVGGWGNYLDMDYNGTTGLYEYNRSFAQSGIFDWNVSCTGVDSITLLDNVTINNSEPTLTEGISLNPIKGSYNTTVNVTTIDAYDPDGNDLILRCGDSSGSYNLCNSTPQQPQVSCLFNSTWTDNGYHTVYCIVTDTEYNSWERDAWFEADNTPPEPGTTWKVEDDAVPKYWDIDDDNETIVKVNYEEVGIRCRYDNISLTYDEMNSSNECNVTGTVVYCNVWNVTLSQINDTTKYIGCEDQYGNDQSISNNTNVTFGVDWTVPSVISDNNEAVIYALGHDVNLTIYDRPVGTVVSVLWCNDSNTTPACEPSASFTGTNGSIYPITFNQRGVWYLRWNASDEAGNVNETKYTIVHINQLIVLESHAYYNLSNHTFRVDVNASDPDTSQSISCWLYHRLNGTGAYDNKAMSLITGVAWNGTWSANISKADGYSTDDLIEMYVNCTDGLEWVNNLPSTTNALPNLAPMFNLSNPIQNQTWPEDTTNAAINLTQHFYDPDGDDLNFTSTVPANITVYIDNNTGNVTLVPDGNFTGIRNIIFYAFDDGLSNSSNLVILNITPINDVPTVPVIDLIPDFPTTVDDLNCTVTTPAFDVDGDIVEYYYEWYKDNILNRTVKTTQEWNVLGAGNTTKGDEWNCTVIATDGLLNASAVSDVVVLINSPPTFDVAIPDKTVNEDESWSYDVDCTDVNKDDIITYYDNASLFDINETTGLINHTPVEVEVGSYSINITCGDGELNTSAVFVYTINNLAPEISPVIPNMSKVQDIAWSYDANTTDDNDSLTWQINSTLLDINATTGLINDSPVEAEAGRYVINVTVTDMWGASDTNIFIYEINDTNPPDITFVSPTPGNDTRRINNQETINASIVEVNVISSCLLEWNNGTDTVNYSMSLIGTYCSMTMLTLDGTPYIFKVWANDSSNNWNVSETRVFRENAKPVITTVNITPDFPDTHSILNCSADWFDADGDSANYSYRWFDNGIEIVGESNQTYNCSKPGCDKWDNITCEVTPWDGYENGSALNASTLIYGIFPSVAGLPNITFYEESYNDSINLSNYVIDLDSNVLDINWSYGGDTANLIIYIDNVTKIINVSADIDWFGKRNITLTAIDEDGLVGSNWTWVIVTNVNDVPTWSTINVLPVAGKNGTTVKVTTVNARDVDDDNLVLRCGESDFNWNLCNSSAQAAPPELSCSFNSSWTDDGVHDIYCRLYENTTSYTSRRIRTFTADNTQPLPVVIQTIAGDVADGGFWDTQNDSKTIVVAYASETPIDCRWNESDLAYSAMAGSCNELGTVVECDLGNLSQVNLTTYHISCVDQYGNEQNSSQNTDFSFGVDWTAPSTYDSHPGGIWAPPYNVTINETDVPPNTTIYTWYCVDITPPYNCTPTTPIDDGENVTFTFRGENHLRYYSNDSATPPNIQTPVKDTTVMINRLVTLTPHITTNITHAFKVEVNATDADAQNISCWLYHRTGAGAYRNKSMSLIAGDKWNGTWRADISGADGYLYNDVIEFYVNCTDDLEYVNDSATTNTIPNQIPVFERAWDDAEFVKPGAIVTINTSSYDPDGDTLKLFVCNSTNINFNGCLDKEYCNDTSSTTNASCSFNAEPVDGIHYWYAFIYDSLGAIADDNYTGNYTTDSIAPTINITSPQNDSWTNDDMPTIWFITIDNFDYQIDFKLFVDSSLRSSSYAINDTPRPVTIPGFPAPLSEGLHKIIIEVTDDAGNSANSSELYLNVDLTSPNSTIITPVDQGQISKQDIPYNVTGNASDNYVLDRVELNISDVMVIANGTTDWSYNWSPGDGKYTLQSIAVDQAGNRETAIEDVIVFVYATSDINNSNVTNSTIINSTIINSTKINDVIINSTIINSTNYDSNITNSNETNSEINDSIITDSTINDSTIINSTINESTVLDSTKINDVIINSTIINSTNYDSNITNSNETNSEINDSIIIDATINDSTIINSTINESTVLDSTKIDSIIINCTINDSVDYNDYLINVNESNSRINGSTLINVTSINCTIINSNLSDSSCKDTIIINSTIIDCVYINAVILNSNDTGSTQYSGYLYMDNGVSNPNIYYGAVYIEDSTVRNSIIDDSNITTNSLVNLSIINESVVSNSTVISSDVKNSTVENNGLISELGLTGLINFTVVDANVTNKYLYLGNITYQNDNYSWAVLGDWPLINIYAKCGNNVCEDYAANCGTTNDYPECNIDCNVCPAPPAPPSAPPRRAPARPRPSICGEEWQCDPWGACLPNGTQYRTCWDLNRCEELYSQRIVTYVNKSIKPEEVRSCVFVPVCFPNITLFGPVIANRTTAATDVYSYEFSAEPGDYILYIGNNFDAAAWIDLNEVEIATPSDFKPGIPLIVKEVSLAAENELKVEITSKPGSNIVLWIGNLCRCIDEECIAGYECVSGRCIPPPSCSDLIQNQEEEGIDCGGPCVPCVEIPVPVVKPTIIQRIVEFVKNKILPFIESAAKFISSNIANIAKFIGKNLISAIKTVSSRISLFIEEKYMPFSKNVISGSVVFIKDNWNMLLYTLIAVIVLVGVVYTSKNYEKMMFYKRYTSYKQGKEREKRELMLKKEAIMKAKKTEEEENLRAKMREQYMNNLNNFLAMAISRGYTKERIKRLLVERGWPKRFVSRYCDRYFEVNKEQVEKAKQMVLEARRAGRFEQELGRIEEELKGSAEFIEKELPKKWIKPGKAKELEKKRLRKKPLLAEKAAQEAEKEVGILQAQLEKLDKELKSLKK